MSTERECNNLIDEISKNLKSESEIDKIRFCCLWNKTYAAKDCKSLSVKLKTESSYLGNYCNYLFDKHQELNSHDFNVFMIKLREKIRFNDFRMDSYLLDPSEFNS